MDDNMSDFIRHLRRQLGMTQEEFAHSLGITVGTVNRWENGRFRPSKLARATILEFARRHGVAVQAEQDGSDIAVGRRQADPLSSARSARRRARPLTGGRGRRCCSAAPADRRRRARAPYTIVSPSGKASSVPTPGTGAELHRRRRRW